MKDILSRGMFSFLNSMLVAVESRIAGMYRIPSVEQIYDEHFSRYPVSDTVKNELLTELKLILNFIHYKKEKKEDFLHLMLSLQKYAKQPNSGMTVEQEISYLDRCHFSHDTAPVSEAIDLSSYCPSFQRFILRQKSLIRTYRLPYTIDNCSIAYINLYDAISAKDTPPAGQRSIVDDTTVKNRVESLKHFAWENGDILLGHLDLNESGGSLQGFYNHAGIYSEKKKTVIDARLAGVHESRWEFWAESYSDFAIVRLTGLKKTVREKVESYILQKIDEPFSLSTYKRNEYTGWYCSKLVYLSYLHAGIDLDAKKSVSVLPDDLILSSAPKTVFCLESK